VRAPVRSLLVEGGRVEGVVMERGGEAIRCPLVISSAGAWNTFERLVPAEHQHLVGPPLRALRDRALWSAPGEQSSSAHMMLFVALEGDREALSLPASNYWIKGPGCLTADGRTEGATHAEAQRRYAAAGVEGAGGGGEGEGEGEGGAGGGGAPFPAVFLSFPSTKDSDWARRYPGKSTAHIIVEGNWDWFREWEDKRVKHRGPAYEALKVEV
jgi:all-trans-retinol 13,14-reductase